MRRPFSLVPAALSANKDDELEEGFRTVIVAMDRRQDGSAVATKNGVTPTIIEMNHANLSTIRADGYRAVLGDANHIETLKHAGVGTSLSLILSASTIRGAAEIIRLARELNPKIKVIVRSAYLRERLPLIEHGPTRFSQVRVKSRWLWPSTSCAIWVPLRSRLTVSVTVCVQIY